ncbi:GntR family transcriptional regulator [Paracoccus sp. 1_MG-2023]|uniref:GntR family transcriptional regulator n=1 Tax=unclassified Paracoccus (in: a-proteobacteria) TaxID=2688777 RepID=UPI001C0A6103|nr:MULTISPECIES: GntR family transcriptional regulator [unclassified Paracoccus (in: a-proteobacteria)]MBU2956057.1 GntR family transcriptional regulator [Paracoccus sp. C2R09]MDO6669463.1 GntR family transcriptional regulator [Paracoccus sp. 1_MG-2023]
MTGIQHSADRKSSVETIVGQLRSEILSMRLLPGARISEQDVADRFGVSRQPVRDAFNRLESMELIVIRPKRATEVKRFSMASIEKSRFIRAAVEEAVLRQAALACTVADGFLLDANMALQRKALAERNHPDFARLDYEFHRLICQIAGRPYAFDVICAEKQKVDRLCLLSLSKEDRMQQLIDDHLAIADAIRAHDAQAAAKTGMLHLSRLDETIRTIKATSGAYFEPDETLPEDAAAAIEI